jgi:hypothetical protein
MGHQNELEGVLQETPPQIKRKMNIRRVESSAQLGTSPSHHSAGRTLYDNLEVTKQSQSNQPHQAFKQM